MEILQTISAISEVLLWAGAGVMAARVWTISTEALKILKMVRKRMEGK